MTPTNEELQDLIRAAESNEFGGCGKLIAHLARAELSRREPVRVPEALVEQWFDEWNEGSTQRALVYIANKAAQWALGRE